MSEIHLVIQDQPQAVTDAAPRPSRELLASESVVRKSRRGKAGKVVYDDNMLSTFHVRHSVIPTIAAEVAFYTLWSVLWTVLYKTTNALSGLAVNPLIITILGVVMGLLLVFRTNTAYDRYWEARRLWGTLFTHARNLARFVWVAVKVKQPHDQLEKHAVMNLILAYVVACKHHLRFEYGTKYEDLHQLLVHLPEYKPSELHSTLDNLPLEISFHISAFVQKTRSQDQVDIPTTSNMITALSGMIDCLSSFERIRDSPIPKAYSIHLKQTLFLYLATLPFQLLQQLGWVTIPVVFIASFTLLGILAIAGEIENPFGYDVNDLHLEDFCNTLKDEFINIMSRTYDLDPATWDRPVRMSDFHRLITTNEDRKQK
ncbi:Bestrophin, RFP-TM, chloride channel-domain-containing protein [Gorgonomyces haynaldii]|nr:Bestrophin, RFP-TM, chloride channel-domain-containing protein [Gorgonomyces haynaldii]